MKISKSLFAIAATLIATMGLASSAMASGGVVRDVTTNAIIPNGTKTEYKGWAKFTGGLGAFTCHVVSTSEATGTAGNTGKVTKFEANGTENCSGSGFLAGCTLESHSTTNLPYHVTVTKEDLDVTGTIVLHNKYKGFLCPLNGEEVTLTFSAITLTPLKTGTTAVTGTSNKLGGTSKPGEPIAGFDISGNGEIHRETTGETEAITASGELEVSDANRCTWKIATS
jgi:hypothetical protein